MYKIRLEQELAKFADFEVTDTNTGWYVQLSFLESTLEESNDFCWNMWCDLNEELSEFLNTEKLELTDFDNDHDTMWFSVVKK